MEPSKMADIVSSLVAREFIKANMCSVCLPATLILLEQLTKLGIQPSLDHGMLCYDTIPAPLHFWATLNGKILDPSAKVTAHQIRKRTKMDVDPNKFIYLPHVQSELGEEEWRMLQAFHAVMQTGDVSEYFREAPDILKSVRSSVTRRVNRMFCKKASK